MIRCWIQQCRLDSSNQPNFGSSIANIDGDDRARHVTKVSGELLVVNGDLLTETLRFRVRRGLSSPTEHLGDLP